MIVTISGTPGSGKSTVARMLAGRLGFRYHSMGKLVRSFARERGISLAQLRAKMERNPSYDRAVDATAAKLGRTHDDFVLEGRLGFFFIPNSLKVFLTVDAKEAARRIWRDVNAGKRKEEERTSLAAIYRDIRRRDAADRLRYRKLYRLDYRARKHYDLVLSTTRRTPEQVVVALVRWLRLRARRRGARAARLRR